MAARWHKNRNFNPSLVLTRIRAANKSPVGQSPSFDAFALEWPRAALSTMIEIGDDISAFAKQLALTRGIHAASALSGDLTPDALLAAVNAELKKLHRTREADFVLTTSISLAAPPPSRVARVRGCEIEYLKGDFPRKFKSRGELGKHWHDSSKPEHTPADYVKVLVRAKAKLSHDAAAACLDALDIHRALTCLFENFRFSIPMGSTHRPINRVMLGGLHGLHFADGSLAEEFHWYQPAFTRVSPHEISNSAIAAKNHRWALRQLSKASPGHRARIQSSLLRYVRGFDEPDRGSGFLRAWGALESLMASSGNENETVIRRTCFLFDQPSISARFWNTSA